MFGKLAPQSQINGFCIIAMKLLLCFAYLCVLVFGGKFDPTPDEISRALVVKPRGTWGQRVRKDNSLRLLCIGGSNTEKNVYNKGYVTLLHEYIQNNITKNSHFRDTSYALNRGVSGMMPTYFTGKKFDFEKLDTAVWPNVVMLEFTVNSGTNIVWETICRRLETLVRSIMYKYENKGLPSPDFMLYEVLFMRDVFLQSEIADTVEARWAWMQEFSTTLYNKTRNTNMLQSEFAAFYGFPVLSWGEVTFPALLRQFLSETRTLYVEKLQVTKTVWPYSADGVHMSIPFGTTFAVNNILGPFFKDMMRPRTEDGTAYPLDLRMFPPQRTEMELVSYSSVDPYGSLPLQDIVHNDSDWSFIKTIHDQQCYGSEVQNSVGRLVFDVPSQCVMPSVPCSVEVSFMHSWDRNFVGKTQCTLYSVSKTGKFTQRSRVITIDGTHGVGQATFPVKSKLSMNLERGMHAVQCLNLDGKHACLTALDINGFATV